MRGSGAMRALGGERHGSAEAVASSCVKRGGGESGARSEEVGGDAGRSRLLAEGDDETIGLRRHHVARRRVLGAVGSPRAAPAVRLQRLPYQAKGVS